jgi:crotonobetainyl-CoA:carnitine CoA-transferase CaiB-like acyl-CoA transferase
VIEGALPGVRVVEWGNFISAPFCGKVLTELGADVIKLEAPISGDDSRRHGPYPGGVADQERSGLFLLANINKRGVSLDLRSQKGREVLDRLLEGADVFLLN